jgi:hypothetical protein
MAEIVENESVKVIVRLAKLMTAVQARAGADFSGLGIIVCDSPSVLPIVPLRPFRRTNSGAPTVDCFMEISSLHSEFHDGFHVVTSNLEISLLAQYFSPPIFGALEVDYSKPFGGRYLAALYGSVINGVVATGIVSNGFGVAVFEHGKETYYKGPL